MLRFWKLTQLVLLGLYGQSSHNCSFKGRLGVKSYANPSNFRPSDAKVILIVERRHAGSRMQGFVHATNSFAW